MAECKISANQVWEKYQDCLANHDELLGKRDELVDELENLTKGNIDVSDVRDFVSEAHKAFQKATMI